VPHDGSYTIWAEGFVGYKRCLVGRTYVTVDSTGPVVSLSARTVSSTVASYAWKVSDKGSGVAKVSAYVLRNGVKIWGATVGAAGQVSLPRTNGSLYQLVVGARDGLGNVRNVKRSLSVPYDDRSFTFSAGWSSLKSQTAFLGGLTRSSTSGAKARLKAYGSHFSLLTTTCPTCGIVAVWVDGKHIRDVSLYSPVNHPLVRTSLAAFTSTKERSIVLVVKGAKVAHSHGKAVLVDGLVAS
jgi:hypothetical protein